MSEQKTMTQILSSQRVIAFNPLFADVAGDAMAGLMLSQLCYWSERTNRKDGWFYKTRDEWFLEARLTRYNVETSRKKLEKLGVISYKLMGVPAVGHYRVNYLILESKIKDVYDENNNKINSLPESYKLQEKTKNPLKSTVGCNPTNKTAAIQPTRRLQSNQQDGCNPTNKTAAIQPTITESTQESTQRVNTNITYSAEIQDAQTSQGGSRAEFDAAMKKLGIKTSAKAQKAGQGEAQAQK